MNNKTMMDHQQINLPYNTQESLKTKLALPTRLTTRFCCELQCSTQLLSHTLLIVPQYKIVGWKSFNRGEIGMDSVSLKPLTLIVIPRLRINSFDQQLGPGTALPPSSMKNNACFWGDGNLGRCQFWEMAIWGNGYIMCKRLGCVPLHYIPL